MRSFAYSFDCSSTTKQHGYGLPLVDVLAVHSSMSPFTRSVPDRKGALTRIYNYGINHPLRTNLAFIGDTTASHAAPRCG